MTSALQLVRLLLPQQTRNATSSRSSADAESSMNHPVTARLPCARESVRVVEASARCAYTPCGVCSDAHPLVGQTKPALKILLDAPRTNRTPCQSVCVATPTRMARASWLELRLRALEVLQAEATLANLFRVRDSSGDCVRDMYVPLFSHRNSCLSQCHKGSLRTVEASRGYTA